MTAAEVIARALCYDRGFGYYDDPIEGGPDAYDISCEALREAAAILATLRGAGFAVVPREPSEYMVDEGSLHTGGLLGKAALTYRAMVAAAEPASDGEGASYQESR